MRETDMDYFKMAEFSRAVTEKTEKIRSRQACQQLQINCRHIIEVVPAPRIIFTLSSVWESNRKTWSRSCDIAIFLGGYKELCATNIDQEQTDMILERLFEEFIVGLFREEV